MNKDQFIWTPEEYYCDELREKYANFPNQFPVVALVTMGYYGDESREKIPAETVSATLKINFYTFFPPGTKYLTTVVLMLGSV